MGTMVGWYVSTRGRQFVDVCCFSINTSVRGIFVSLFHCFVITLIGYALWSGCMVNSLLCSMKSVFLVHILLHRYIYIYMFVWCVVLGINKSTTKQNNIRHST